MKDNSAMQSVESVKKNALLNIIYTLSNILFPVITFPYITHVLSVHGVGQVYFYQSIATYATMIASLGIGTYGIRATAKVRNDKERLSLVVQELMIINALMTVVVVLTLLILTLFIQKFRSDYNLLWINCISVVSNVIGLNWLYSGLEEYGYITIRSVVFKAISIVLMFIFVKNPNDYLIYAAITVFSTAGSNCLNFFHSKSYIKLKKTKSFNFKQHIKPMMILFSSALAISVYTNLDTIMLGFIKNSTEVGVFTVASKIKILLLNLVNAISAVLLPRLSFYVSEGQMDKYKAVLKNASSVVLTIAIPISLYFMVFASESIRFISGPGYAKAVVPMQIIMPILVISGFSNIIGNQVLIPNNLEKYFMYAVIFGSIVDFVFNLILMPHFGSSGAAMSTLIAELIQMSVQTYYGFNYLKGNLDFRQIFKVLIATVIALLFAKGMVSIWSSSNSFVILLTSGTIFLLVFVLILLSCKDSIIFTWIKQRR